MLTKVDLNQTDFRKELRDKARIPATGKFQAIFFGADAGDASLACIPLVLAGGKAGAQPVV